MLEPSLCHSVIKRLGVACGGHFLEYYNGTTYSVSKDFPALILISKSWCRTLHMLKI